MSMTQANRRFLRAGRNVALGRKGHVDIQLAFVSVVMDGGVQVVRGTQRRETVKLQPLRLRLLILRVAHDHRQAGGNVDLGLRRRRW